VLTAIVVVALGVFIVNVDWSPIDLVMTIGISCEILLAAILVILRGIGTGEEDDHEHDHDSF